MGGLPTKMSGMARSGYPYWGPLTYTQHNKKHTNKFFFFFVACSHSLLPEYALPALIHLLAHHPDFKPKEHDSLVQFREYVFILS